MTTLHRTRIAMLALLALGRRALAFLGASRHRFTSAQALRPKRMAKRITAKINLASSKWVIGVSFEVSPPDALVQRG
jgi:hypothetical protein